MIYHAVIFDLDGTLRESRPHFMDSLYACLLDMGLDLDPFRWRMAERWVHAYWAQSPELIADVARYGSEQVWNRFLARLMSEVGHPHANDDEINQFGERMQARFQPVSELTPGALDVLTFLREQHVVMGVLSNRGKPFTDELDKLGISHFFDFALSAGEVGVWKPHPEIFHVALKRIGATSDQVIYVGDNYYADILGARNADLAAILVDWRRVFTDAPGIRVESLLEILPYLSGDADILSQKEN